MLLLAAAGMLVSVSAVQAYPLVTTVADTNEPRTGDTVTVDVTIDLTGGSDQLGTYSFDISWDPAVLSYVSIVGGTTPGFETLNKNESAVASGSLPVNHFYTVGAGGSVHVARLAFETVGGADASTLVSIGVNALNAATTFADLTGDVDTSFCHITVSSYTGPVIESVVIDPNSGTIRPGDTVDITVTATGNQTGLTPSDATFLRQQIPLTDQGDGTYTGSYTIMEGDQAQEFDSSALFMDDFESGAFDQWYWVDGSIHASDESKYGSGSVYADVQGSSMMMLQERFDIPRNEITVSYYFRLDPAFTMAEGSKMYVSMVTGTGGPLYAVRLRKENGQYQLNITRGAFVADIGPWQTIESGEWNWIKIHYRSATDGISQWWLNGIPAGSYEGDLSGTPMSILNVLYIGGIPSTTIGHIFVDHFQLTLGDHSEPGILEATNITLTDTVYGLTSPPASSTGSTLVIDDSAPVPVIESVTIAPSSGIVGVGDSVTVTVTEVHGMTGLTATPASVNGASVPLVDLGGGVYEGVYVVHEGDSDAVNVEATGIVLTGEEGSSQTGSSTGSTLAVDGNTPVISQVTIDPLSGYLTAEDTVLITATAQGSETGLTASSAMINGVSVPLTESGDGVYSGTYTVLADHAQGVNLQASGVTLTDAAGNTSSAVSSAQSTLVIDTQAPVISSVTISPGTGTIVPGESVVITVTDATAESGLTISDATVNSTTVNLTALGDGVYEGVYTAATDDPTGVVLEATGITLTDPAGNASAAGASSGSTVIIVTPALSVLSPNGGEQFAIGSMQPVVWESDNLDMVRIEYSTDNGENWTVAADSLDADSGSYQWEVPAVVSTDWLIRISSVADLSTNDVSNAVFETISIPTELSHYTVAVSNTGVNAILLIPAASLPDIDGQPAAIGDEIAVITPRGTVAGAGVWTGTSLAITIWGDDVLEEGILGFQTGEALSFEIWDESSDTVHEMAATYESGAGTFMPNGVSTVSSLFSLLAPDYILPLAAGWNQISAPYVPGNPAMDAMMFSIRQHLIIAKNGDGEVYWPEFSVNQIGEWTVSEGYQIKLAEADTLDIRGTLVTSDEVVYNLDAGWHLISYTGPDGLSPAAAFAGAGEDVFMVKDSLGQVYWPLSDGVIDQIRTMSRGMAYWIKLTAAVSFTYPSGTAKPSTEYPEPLPVSWFDVPSSTGTSATYLFEADWSDPTTAGLFSTGDEIGIFDGAGHCVGAGVWDGDRIAVNAWGDDALTAVQDGLLNGETLRMLLWDHESGVEYELAGSGAADAVTFEPNGAERITLTVQLTGREQPLAQAPEQFALLQNFPNPFNPVTTIEYAIPRDTHVYLAVYTVSGQQIDVLEDGMRSAGTHAVVWNAADYPSGVYFCRFTAENAIRTTKLLLVK